ncbi:MAG: trypsin-like peptidase domain-containing protein [Candidatus Alcyoniella australis]|nr:trypsin-like peptidase domain-containing protein [Candidatus Alcyoniella australis]
MAQAKRLLTIVLIVLTSAMLCSCIVLTRNNNTRAVQQTGPHYPPGLGSAAPAELWTEGSLDPIGRVQINSTTYSDLADQVNPAVVNIFTTAEIQAGMSFGILQVPLPGLDYEANSLGTGFLITDDGFIVTNNHVIEHADQIGVVLPDRAQIASARVIGRDPIIDLALLKIETDRALPYLRLGDSERARVGDFTVAVGNPFGLSGTVTMGILSAKGRTISSGTLREGFEDYLQTSAQINPGNSGGPLVDLRGQVIGVNTAIIQGAQGIGFAVPINLVKDVLPILAREGRVRRATVGVAVTEITPKLRQSRNLPSAGALVSRVYRGGPAEYSGLRRGDVVTAIDGQAVESPRDFVRLISGSAPGSALRLTVWRSGETITANVKAVALK